MIWFLCKQCGKRLKQHDSAAGSLVFCDCGQGNRVPWESSIPEPIETPAEMPPRGDPFDEEDRPRRRRRPEPIPRDPAYCFNHQAVPAEQTCGDCGEHFCPACVVQVRGKTLCGPCKNYRVARLLRPRSVSGMAIISLVLAIVGGPLAFCLSFTGRINENAVSAYSLGFGIAALLVPTLALLLALLALREMDRNPRVGGRGLAITGAATAVVGVVWSVTMILVVAGKPLFN